MRKFWSRFFHKDWQKNSKVYRNLNAPLAEVNSLEIFSSLTRYADFCLKLGSCNGFKLFVDGQLFYPEDTLQFLPVKTDQNFLGYHERMSQYFTDYCLVCDELLRVDGSFNDKVLDFTDGLFRAIGFPIQFAELGFYMGNYKKTPFGVHVDNCHVFSFPLLGEKKFRIWKPSIVKKYPKLERAHSYSRYKQYSKVLKASPGDMTYWPSTAWHIAESNGSFSATWSIGVWNDKSSTETIIESIVPLLNRQIQAANETWFIKSSTTDPFNGKTSLPNEFENAVDRINEISKSDLHNVLLKDWLKHFSKMGLKNCERNTQFLIPNLKSKIQLKRANSLFWNTDKSKKILFVAFKGDLIEVKNSALNIKIIKNLNSGKPCLISNYIKNPKQINAWDLVKKLDKLGALIK